MATAAVDVLGFLPGPVSKNNAGAADLLAGELFAYAVSSGVAVVDVSGNVQLQMLHSHCCCSANLQHLTGFLGTARSIECS